MWHEFDRIIPHISAQFNEKFPNNFCYNLFLHPLKTRKRFGAAIPPARGSLVINKYGDTEGNPRIPKTRPAPCAARFPNSGIRAISAPFSNEGLPGFYGLSFLWYTICRSPNRTSSWLCAKPSFSSKRREAAFFCCVSATTCVSRRSSWQ